MFEPLEWIFSEKKMPFCFNSWVKLIKKVQTNAYVMCTTLVEVISQCYGNKERSTVLPVKPTDLVAELCSSAFNYPRNKYLSSRISTKREFRISKVVEIRVFVMGESSEFFLFPLILKRASPKTFILFLAIGGLILRFNQLYNIDKLLNTN